MVEYKCLRCGYITTKRCNFKDHISRKNICMPILEDISIEYIKKYYNIKTCSELLPIAPSDAPNCSELLLTNKSNSICDYCQKTFSRNSNLTKHLKICKKKSNILSLKQDEEIINIKKELEELKESINITNNTNNTTNNTNNNNNNTNNINNNTQNIIINNYGEENIKYLHSKYFKHLLSNVSDAIPKLIKYIHFNEEHPENHNIKYTNKDEPYFEIMKNNKWILVPKDTEILNIIYKNNCLLLENYYKLLRKESNFTNIEKQQIENFINKYKMKDTTLINDLIEISKIVLYNNSKEK